MPHQQIQLAVMVEVACNQLLRQSPVERGKGWGRTLLERPVAIPEKYAQLFALNAARRGIPPYCEIELAVLVEVPTHDLIRVRQAGQSDRRGKGVVAVPTHKRHDARRCVLVDINNISRGCIPKSS